MFLVILAYKKPIEDIEKALPGHVLFLDNYYKNKKFIFSGRRKPRTGGVILVNSNDKEEVINIIQQDPFHKDGLADYEIIEFTPTKCDERFSQFLS
jgi:uncharacterized protein YciI